ncbi:MAG: 5'-nucleotidase [Dehalococcoidia bacterium]|jgi:5'-nucleotidase|nr:5'-nucleotidase [Dehalococcoidia bacterium]
MLYSLSEKLVIGITSRALFDLDEAHRVYSEQGLEAYRAYQIQREAETLGPGTGLPLVRSLLRINDLGKGRLVEVILISRNDADSGMRIMNSVEDHGLDITRFAFTDGPTAHRYLKPFYCDLFLSAQAEDVQNALDAGFPAALVYPPPSPLPDESGQVRIAFDGDAVLFDEQSERIFQEQGMEEFKRHEAELEETPLNPGPFMDFLEAISNIQRAFSDSDNPIRITLVTSRDAPAHKRPIKTLRAWGIRLDECFFLGGIEKGPILHALRPHIYFDDQRFHLESSAKNTPSAQVLSDLEPRG